MAQQAPKGICPHCGKKGLGLVFGHSSGGYRQCQYCSGFVPAVAASARTKEAATSLVGRVFQCGAQRATIEKMGTKFATVRLNGGAVGKIEASVFSGPCWTEIVT